VYRRIDGVWLAGTTMSVPADVEHGQAATAVFW
jgi:hypothetical protein